MSVVRLDKLLGNLGYGSRREAQALAALGRIKLDGAPLLDASEKVETEGLEGRLVIDGAPVDPMPGLVLALHKPIGVTCSTKDPSALVYDLLPARWRRREPAISTVGRLDKDTSGLLLLTDDGDFLHRVISPKARVEKLYRATLARPLRGDEAAAFASGRLTLEGDPDPLLPARLEIVSPTEALLAVTEGRYHQVRRMFAAVGNHVVTLRRERIGGLALPPDLAEGAYRRLGEAERAMVFAAG